MKISTQEIMKKKRFRSKVRRFLVLELFPAVHYIFYAKAGIKGFPSGLGNLGL
jgi:hypothetical protein